MSLAEIKDSIGALSVEERLDLAAWIAHLNHADDPAYLAELKARMASMELKLIRRDHGSTLALP